MMSMVNSFALKLFTAYQNALMCGSLLVGEVFHGWEFVAWPRCDDPGVACCDVPALVAGASHAHDPESLVGVWVDV
jgi:hypothetical protein